MSIIAGQGPRLCPAYLLRIDFAGGWGGHALFQQLPLNLEPGIWFGSGLQQVGDAWCGVFEIEREIEREVEREREPWTE
jgi:hypothetical protein